MKTILLASIILSGAPLLAESETSRKTEVVVAEERFQLGKEVVKKVRAEYQAGSYREFLQEMEKAYQSAKSENGLEGLIEIRTAEMPVPTEKFLTGYAEIQREKNSALIKAVAGQPDSLLVEKVRSAATTPTSDEQKALKALSTLRSKVPGSGKNSDENQLIAIDLEHAYKAIHLDSLIANGKKIPDRQEKQLLLEMVRMDQIVQASGSFEDKELKGDVSKAAVSFDDRLAKMYDLSDLTKLANGRLQPVSALEEKVGSVLLQANEQMADLHLETMMQSSPANDDEKAAANSPK